MQIRGLSLFEEKCRICEKRFSHEICSVTRANLSKHVVNAYNISMADYILDNKSWPLCGCGCGNRVVYSKWHFNKYYRNHKDRVPQSNEIKQKIRKGLRSKYYEKVRKGIVDINLIKQMWNDYKDNADTNLLKVSKRSGYDKRTIKNYWWKFGITTKVEIKRQAKLHKEVYSHAGEKNNQYCKIEDDVLNNIFDLLTDRKNVLTLSYIKYRFGISYSTDVIFKRLVEKFGRDTIKSLLKFRGSCVSVEEASFGNVLSFYFGEKNVKPQFKIKYIEDGKKKHKFYDFCLFNKLLIEYDGDYWHQDSQQNDSVKDALAIKNNFTIFRINSKEAKNIEILSKIKGIVDEI